MSDSLIQAYLPLLFWSGLGIFALRFVPDETPRRLGRGLYWVGVPLEIFVLARQTPFSPNTGLAPTFTLLALVLGLGLAILSLQGVRWLNPDPDDAGSPKLEPTAPTAETPTTPNEPGEPIQFGPTLSLQPEDVPPVMAPLLLPLPTRLQTQSCQGSFILSSIIGNTGFVGLAIAPSFVNDAYLGWIVLYSVTHNVVGTYGLGVFLASYFGRGQHDRNGWTQVRDVLTVPSLWAFGLGLASRSVTLPPLAESALHGSIWLVIPAALLLMGMRLSQLQGWHSLKLAVVPSALKVMAIPALVGLIALAIHLPPEATLALVLMSGMPSAFGGLVLAEEYDLDRDLIAGSIALSTGLLLLTIPAWLFLFS